MERQHQMQTDEQEVEGKQQAETKRRDAVQQSKHHEHPNPPAASPSPPSSSSSPSHEFSFTISIHPSVATLPPSNSTEKNKTNTPPPLAVDLSPADEIFFHGHLLPLHLLSHHPVPPRSSAKAMDSFTPPVKESSEFNNQTTPTRKDDHHTGTSIDTSQGGSLLEGQGTGKSKSSSLFGLPKWRKGSETREEGYQEGQKRKSRFDMSHFLQKYMRLIKPFISLRNRRENPQIHRQNCSFSGNLKFKSRLKGLSGRREFSAPASMTNSPTNSKVLAASGNITPTNYAYNNNNTSESAMEELQAAIQAAIAHCKKSIAADEDKNKLP